MFKLSLNAGHGMGTAGKRCMKSLDANETREWWLNDRIADEIEKRLSEYDGIEILRTDDTTGAKDVSVTTRLSNADKWGADFYLSIHHNAGIKGGTGGGIVAFLHTSPLAESVEWQDALYSAAIEATGLKGNRAVPKPKKNLAELRIAKMPAVLMECGFMDSATDVPIILTDAYSEALAKAFVEVIVKRAGLKKKATEAERAKKLYHVQVGSFSKKKYAESMLTKLKGKGFLGYVKTAKDGVKVRYRVQVGAYSKKSNATAMLAKLKSAGFSGYVTV